MTKSIVPRSLLSLIASVCLACISSPAFAQRGGGGGFQGRGFRDGRFFGAIQLYLKDGTMYSVRDYWLVDGKLHYIAMDRSEAVLELDAIDFQRTVDENAKRGVPFTLKPNPTVRSRRRRIGTRRRYWPRYRYFRNVAPSEG